MREVNSPYPPGVVLTPTSGTPRFMEFFNSMERLYVPAGTGLPVYSKSADLAAALNLMIEATKGRGEWVWFLGDDHTFEPDVLLKLLAHNLPAVCPLNVNRHNPFGPVILQGKPGPGMKGISWGQVPPPSLWTLPEDLHTGQAGLLIRRETLERLTPPYFRVGLYNPERMNEDIYFNESLRAIGVPTIVDTSIVLGHLNSFAVVPVYIDGRWHVAFQRDGKTTHIGQGRV